MLFRFVHTCLRSAELAKRSEIPKPKSISLRFGQLRVPFSKSKGGARQATVQGTHAHRDRPCMRHSSHSGYHNDMKKLRRHRYHCGRQTWQPQCDYKTSRSRRIASDEVILFRGANSMASRTLWNMSRDEGLDRLPRLMPSFGLYTRIEIMRTL